MNLIARPPIYGSGLDCDELPAEKSRQARTRNLPRLIDAGPVVARRQAGKLRRDQTGSNNRADAQLSKPKPISNSAFQLNNHAFEPGLFEPKSLLPGNGIFRAETKRPKRLQRVRDAVAETKSR